MANTHAHKHEPPALFLQIIPTSYILQTSVLLTSFFLYPGKIFLKNFIHFLIHDFIHEKLTVQIADTGDVFHK